MGSHPPRWSATAPTAHRQTPRRQSRAPISAPCRWGPIRRPAWPAQTGCTATAAAACGRNGRCRPKPATRMQAGRQRIGRDQQPELGVGDAEQGRELRPQRHHDHEIENMRELDAGQGDQQPEFAPGRQRRRHGLEWEQTYITSDGEPSMRRGFAAPYHPDHEPGHADPFGPVRPKPAAARHRVGADGGRGPHRLPGRRAARRWPPCWGCVLARPAAFPFQVLVGTSAGALNAAFLASCATAGLGAFDQLASFWGRIRSATSTGWT
jgi:hypothetical protein